MNLQISEFFLFCVIFHFRSKVDRKLLDLPPLPDGQHQHGHQQHLHKIQICILPSAWAVCMHQWINLGIHTPCFTQTLLNPKMPVIILLYNVCMHSLQIWVSGFCADGCVVKMQHFMPLIFLCSISCIW